MAYAEERELIGDGGEKKAVVREAYLVSDSPKGRKTRGENRMTNQQAGPPRAEKCWIARPDPVSRYPPNCRKLIHRWRGRQRMWMPSFSNSGATASAALRLFSTIVTASKWAGLTQRRTRHR